MNTTRTKIFNDKSEYTEFKKQPNIKVMGVFIATENDVLNNPNEDLIANQSIFISYQKTTDDADLHKTYRNDNYGNRGNFGKFGY